MSFNYVLFKKEKKEIKKIFSRIHYIERFKIISTSYTRRSKIENNKKINLNHLKLKIISTSKRLYDSQLPNWFPAAVTTGCWNTVITSGRPSLWIMTHWWSLGEINTSNDNDHRDRSLQNVFKAIGTKKDRKKEKCRISTFFTPFVWWLLWRCYLLNKEFLLLIWTMNNPNSRIKITVILKAWKNEQYN